jgi:hypothetical protein
MRILGAVILGVAIGFAAAYAIVSKQKDALLEKLKAQPPAAVAVAAPAAAPAEKVVVVSVPAAPAGESSQDIINDLLNVKLGAGSDRNAELRRVVFKLESLAQRGKLAVPAIREFIGRNVDVDYGPSDNSSATPSATVASGLSNRGSLGGRSGARRARDLQSLRPNWVVPPSLRLGLLGTLKEIGGQESEMALVEMLSATGRGVEVAYLTVLLEEIAPGKYRDACVSAAKELLMNPPAIDDPDNLDQLSRSYLYGVLEYFQDTTFAINAQQMLVGKDGRLDQDALDYLSTVMKDLSVSALYAAYENPALTNQIDRTRVRNEVLSYVGPNSQANALLTETLTDPNLDSRVKAFTIMQLAGGSDAPTDPQLAASRVSLLNSLLAQPQFANDPVFSKVIPATVTALQSGQDVQLQDLQDIFVGGPNRRSRQNNPGGADNGAGAIAPAGP